MIIGIAIDDWKLPIFKRHLLAAGYPFETEPGVTGDSLVLKVIADTHEELLPIATAAQVESAKRKRKHGTN